MNEKNIGMHLKISNHFRLSVTEPKGKSRSVMTATSTLQVAFESRRLTSHLLTDCNPHTFINGALEIIARVRKEHKIAPARTLQRAAKPHLFTLIRPSSQSITCNLPQSL